MEQPNNSMINFKQLMQSMTNRLVLVTVIVFFVIEALFAGAPSGLELYHWQHPNFRPWQIVSYMFMHAGHWHLAFNMLALWSFGRILERVWGNQRFLIFYLISGIGAAIVYLLVNTFVFSNTYYDVMVGASGAVYGVLVGFTLLFPNFKIVLLFFPVPVATKYFVPVLLLIDLSAGVTGISVFGTNVAHFAHLGGALSGLLLVKLWLQKNHNKNIKN